MVTALLMALAVYAGVATVIVVGQARTIHRLAVRLKAERLVTATAEGWWVFRELAEHHSGETPAVPYDGDTDPDEPMSCDSCGGELEPTDDPGLCSACETDCERRQRTARGQEATSL